jgi:hypothetical protein
MSLPTIKQVAKNFTVVTVGDKSVWFSYETPVAFKVEGFKLYVTDERFSTTTDKHLNIIDPDKSRRTNAEKFRELIEI